MVHTSRYQYGKYEEARYDRIDVKTSFRNINCNTVAVRLLGKKMQENNRDSHRL